MKNSRKLHTAARQKRTTSTSFYLRMKRKCVFQMLKILDIGEQVVESALENKNSGELSFTI